MKNSTTRGFTLIELLVTIAIIAILVSIVLAGLNAIRAKGRDAERISDIKLLQSAAASYFDSCYSFPATLGALASTTSCYTRAVVTIVPKDPLTKANYGYYVGTDPMKFHLCATLEYSYGNNKGKAGVKDSVTGDGCDGTDQKVFDVLGGNY